MTLEVVARAFEPFFMTKPEGTGTGLGLAMVFGFVKQSRGHVKIYSEPGDGTTVRIHLPRATVAARATRSDAPVQLPRGSATVLVVEDDAAVREVGGRGPARSRLPAHRGGGRRGPVCAPSRCRRPRSRWC